ncbi:MAG TPA: glycosyltransferase family 4 protein [Anaerolineae bacterium]
MTNVLILTLVFPPDSVSTATIMGNLAEDLKSQGCQVTVVTTTPHYNRDLEAERAQPLRNHWGPLLKTSEYRGITVYHVSMPRKGKNIGLRLLSWLGFHFLSTVAGMTVIPRPDVIVTPSPPLTIGLSAWILAGFYRAPFIYNVQELYPDVAVSLGALKNRYLIGLLQRLERFVYAKAARITTIAPRMRGRILEKGVPPQKVELIPNFVDLEDMPPAPKDNAFSRRYGVHDKFLVSYAGNMGVPQGLDKFVDAAAILRDESGIHFMLLGNGSEKDALEQRAAGYGLANLQILPYQPYSLMPDIYGASDVCLVAQAAETGCDAVPSKVYRIMACGRPVLAVTDLTSDLAALVTGVRCGAAIQAGRAEALAEAIAAAYRNQDAWRAMGERGRQHVVQNYTRPAVTGQYYRLIQNLHDRADQSGRAARVGSHG